jgi:hypothetical protein
MVLLYKSKKKSDKLFKRLYRSFFTAFAYRVTLLKSIFSRSKKKKQRVSKTSFHRNNVFYHSKFHRFIQRHFKLITCLLILIGVTSYGFRLFLPGECSDAHGPTTCISEKIKAYYDRNYHAVMVPWVVGKKLDNYTEFFWRNIQSSAQALVSAPPIPKLNVNIKFKDWKKLKSQRESAVDKGVFFNETQGEYLKAKIDYKGSKIQAKIRLKGKTKDHWSDEKKWSLRVKTKNGSVDGLMRFSIQHPKTRHYQYKSLISQLSEAMDVMHPKTFYVDVYINGDSIGIMEIEEHFDKHTPAVHRRRDGLLFKTNSSPFSGYNPLTIEGSIAGNTLFYPLTNVDRVNKNLIKKSSKDFLLANRLFRAFTLGDLPPEDVFDINNIARSLSVASFFNAGHSMIPGNFYLYFNPVTKKFEVILNEFEAPNAQPYDFMQISNISNYNYMPWLENFKKIIASPKFLPAFKEASKKLTDFVNGHKVEIRKNLATQHTILQREFYALPPIPLDFLIKKQNEKMSLIKDDQFFNHTAPSGYFVDLEDEVRGMRFDKPIPLKEKVFFFVGMEQGKGTIEIFNRYIESVDIERFFIGVNCKDKMLSSELVSLEEVSCERLEKHSLTVPSGIKITKYDTVSYLVEPKAESAKYIHIDNLNKKDVLYLFIPDRKGSPYFMYAKAFLEDTGLVLDVRDGTYYAFIYYGRDVQAPITSMGLPEIKKLPFISLDENKRVATIKKGSWHIDNFIVFPNEYSLTIEAGVNISFDENAGLLLRKGRLLSQGVEQSKVVLSAVDPSRGWRGITVLQGNINENVGRSRLQHTVIRNTNFAQHNDWGTTGAVTFYESDVDIENVHFDGSQAEDTLNIVRSKFTLSRSHFNDTRSDAFDTDFVEGIISHSHFERVGGDAIDFSGSKIVADNTVFSHVNDKAISVGEGTSFSGEKMYVYNSGTGLATKDGSSSLIKDSVFKDISHATLMSYIKKPEYGGAKIVAMNVQYKKSGNAIVAQKKSRIFLNGVKIRTRKVDIEKLYKTGYMKK